MKKTRGSWGETGQVARVLFSLCSFNTSPLYYLRAWHRLNRGRSRIFFRRGCTLLLLYFKTNKPHSFFLQNTSCIRKPQVISGGGGLCAPPAPSPWIRPCINISFNIFLLLLGKIDVGHLWDIE